MLATKLRTPLQVEQHIKLALGAGYLSGEKPVTGALIESVLSKQLNDLEPTLARHGYRIKDLVDQFNVKLARNDLREIGEIIASGKSGCSIQLCPQASRTVQ